MRNNIYMNSYILYTILLSILWSISATGAAGDHKWDIKYDDKDKDKICLLASLDTARLRYSNTTTVEILPPTGAIKNPDSNCTIHESGPKTAYLILNWDTSGKPSSIRLNFSTEGEDLVIQSIDINIPGHSLLFKTKKLLDDTFRVKEKYGYKCNHAVTLQGDDSTGGVSLEFEGIQWEAFRDKDATKIKDREYINVPEKCAKDVELNDKLPTIVGIVMAVVVVVVVGGLVFGRIRFRRTDKDSKY